MIFFCKDDFVNGDVYVHDKYLDYIYYCNGSTMYIDNYSEWKVTTLSLSTLQEWIIEDEGRYIISGNKSKRNVE